MTATEAKEILKDIPDENFTTNTFTDTIDKCCSFGHLYRVKSKSNYEFTTLDDGELRLELLELTSNIEEKLEVIFYDINDNITNEYPQETPKARVLALLEDAIAAGL